MADRSGIEWTDATWGPIVGCTKISAGCDHCYAEGLVNRFAGHNSAFPNRFDVVTLRPQMLDLPLRWRRPRRVFVNSLSDLFHADVSDEYVARVFAVMALAPQHTFQVLTKRHGRMRSLLRSDAFRDLVETEWCRVPDWFHGRLREDGWEPGQWPLPNLWLGVSVEDQQRADLRIPALLDTPAAVRFLSCEPLLGPVDLTRVKPTRVGGSLHRDALRPLLDADDGHPLEPALDWVIVGGESGARARPMHPSWPRALRDQCVDAGVPFHYKQWGAWRPIEPDETRFRRETDWLVRRDGYAWPLTEPHGAEDGTEVTVRRVGKRAAGRDLDGRMWDEVPV